LKTYYNEKNRREQIRYLCENPPGESALAENAPGDDCVAGENALAENAPGDDCVAGEGARDESAFGGDCAAGESARDENPPGEGALAENASGDDCVAGESARDELCAAENPAADNCAQNRFGQSIFNSRAPGFTFVETLAAISIGAILAAGAGLSAAKLIDAARKTAAENQIAVFKAALQTYYVDCGRFPSEPQGLIALWEKPSLSPVPAGWHGPYLDRETIRDPWGNSYIYEENQNRDGVLPFVIISLGADGREGGKGIDSDIFSWK
jgi:general secretion pathway protein G